ncbi:hypothetical protein PENTCL1PPCAC_28117, partial [Pristionchus entomophagus]
VSGKYGRNLKYHDQRWIKVPPLRSKHLGSSDGIHGIDSEANRIDRSRRQGSLSVEQRCSTRTHPIASP